MSRIPSIAVIGAGATGLYIADQLMCQDRALHIDVLDKKPSPAGIAPYAVAPITGGASTTGFIGNVEVGTDVTVAELETLYDVVIDATAITASEFAAAAAISAALVGVDKKEAPLVRITAAEFLAARGVAITTWNNPLNLPTGRSLAAWQDAFRAATGAPVCF